MYSSVHVWLASLLTDMLAGPMGFPYAARLCVLVPLALSGLLAVAQTHLL